MLTFYFVAPEPNPTQAAAEEPVTPSQTSSTNPVEASASQAVTQSGSQLSTAGATAVTSAQEQLVRQVAIFRHNNLLLKCLNWTKKCI